MGQVNYICTSEPILVNVYGAHESIPHAMLSISALLKGLDIRLWLWPTKLNRLAE
jgi:hypothetical protein